MGLKYTQEQHEAVRGSVEKLFRQVAARYEHATVRNDPPGGPAQRPGMLELSCSLPGTTHVRALAGRIRSTSTSAGEPGSN
jgi:hypothetical protein